MSSNQILATVIDAITITNMISRDDSSLIETGQSTATAKNHHETSRL